MRSLLLSFSSTILHHLIQEGYDDVVVDSFQPRHFPVGGTQSICRGSARLSQILNATVSRTS